MSTTETIQMIVDSKLRQAIDRAAKRRKVNRSAFLREAAREHLKRLRTQEMEDRERQAYLAHPQTNEEIYLWEREIAWPEE
jgi:metal-responsive CopG/Arc/MetJ family transcriptional regulator